MHVSSEEPIGKWKIFLCLNGARISKNSLLFSLLSGNLASVCSRWRQYQVRRAGGLDVSLPILLVFSAGLCVLVLLPLSWLVYYSIHDRAGGLTIANFVELATD